MSSASYDYKILLKHHYVPKNPPKAGEGNSRLRWSNRISLSLPKHDPEEAMQGSHLVGDVSNLSRSFWVALLIEFRSGQNKYILKDITRDIYDKFTEEIQPRLCKTNHIRLPCDSISGQRVFVYKYMTDDFLSLVKRGISTRTRKQILKSCLLGIAEMHEQQVVHLGNKQLIRLLSPPGHPC